MFSGVGRQATFLPEFPLAAILLASKRFFASMGSEMPFKIELPFEYLLQVRSGSAAVWVLTYLATRFPTTFRDTHGLSLMGFDHRY
jgi:hypothetical protein